MDLNVVRSKLSLLSFIVAVVVIILYSGKLLESERFVAQFASK